MHPDDEVPTPASPVIVRPSRLFGVVLLIATTLMAFPIAWLMQSMMAPIATEPTAVSGGRGPSQTEPLSVTGSPQSMPPELIQMAVAITTSLAPTPTQVPPTPTYTMLPTPRPPDVCLTSTPRGTVCTQPKPPLPSPTPMAVYPVSPGALCVAQGGPVTWLPTPTPASSTSSNQ